MPQMQDVLKTSNVLDGSLDKQKRRKDQSILSLLLPKRNMELLLTGSNLALNLY